MTALQTIQGHEPTRQRFRDAFARNRLGNTYLFVGADGIGKRTFALALAKSLLCRDKADPLDACGNCANCKLVDSASHPDLIQIRKPADKNYLPLELFTGDREHRRQQGLCHDISLKPFHGDRKIAVIDDADFFNAESANSLLKTLEEPPPDSVLILIGTSEHRQLSTILSRCQVTRFQPLTDGQVSEILQSQSLTGEVPVQKLVAASHGSVSRAMLLDDQELFSFRERLMEQVRSRDPSDQNFSRATIEFIESRSKESSERRAVARLVADFAVEELRELMIGDIERDSGQAEGAAIDRTLEFQYQVSANLALANIVPAWLNDLGRILRGATTVVL